MAASGIRPAAVFVGIVVVFAAVATRSTWIQVFAGGEQPDAVVQQVAPTPRFSIADRSGVSLALSAETFDVTISPRAMWRSHTPDHMARCIAEVLRGDAVPTDADVLTPHQVLERTMPHGFTEGLLPGRLLPESPRVVVFGKDDIPAVRDWLATGAARGRDPGPAIRGIALELLPPTEADAPPRWTLSMHPVLALGADVRREQFGVTVDKDGKERTAAPARWTRRILDDVVALVGAKRVLDRLEESEREAIERLGSNERREKLRDVVWAELMPTRFRVIARGVDPVRAHALLELMDDEGVSGWQIQLVPRVVRRHPTRPDGDPAPPDAELALQRPEDAFLLLGHWGVLDEGRAQRLARRDRDERPHVLPWEEADDPYLAYMRSLVVEQNAWSGVELLCRTELENGPWADLADDVRGRTTTRAQRVVARDRSSAWEDGVASYFVDATDATDVPRVVTTLDAQLQEVVHAELALLMEEHRPAMAMAIAVDVETGDVLALDSVSRYAYSGFAPLLHVFTPGSTFKAIVMAIALDEAVTTPTTTYETFVGIGGLHLPGRIIREAEGAPEEERITAAMGLAESCNAVLVQIALGMAPRRLRERIVALGYDSAPGAGLGPERSGMIPDLDRKGSWSRNWTHASVGFGHEIGVTLWQHAEALATLLRGGERRPLRLLRAIERDGARLARPVERGEQVLGEDACRSVRDMMAMGAEIGTGRHIATRELNPEFEWIGTKTGTTEKVETELCVHVELEALARFARESRKMSRAERKRLLQEPRPHRRGRPCYTSSICAAARLATPDGPREIMVLVVADDATGKERFGSKVTGPTAMAILRQAFGLPRTSTPDDVASPDGVSVEATSTRPALFVAPTRRPGAAAPIATGFSDSFLDEPTPWAPQRARVDTESSTEEPR